MLAPSRRRVLLASLPLLLAVWGQWALFTDRLFLDGAVLFLLSGVLFAVHVLNEQRLVEPIPGAGAAEAQGRTLGWSRLRVPLLTSLVCMAGTWVFSDGNLFRTETVVFWLPALGLYLWCFWERDPGRGPGLVQRLRALSTSRMTLSWTGVCLAGILLLAAFFRFYQIGSIPAEMTSDHAEKLLDVRDVMNGQHHIFFPRNSGREALEFYFAQIFVSLVGLNFLAIKLVIASFSMITVPMTFLIGRELAGARFGLLAAFFLAVSKWEVAIDRVALRPALYPVFVSLSFYFLLRALRRGRRNDYLMCGVMTGLGLYGYQAFRAMLILIAVLVLAKILSEARRGWSPALAVVGKGFLCAGSTLIVLVPLLHFMVENPQMFWFRALTRVTGLEVAAPPNPLGVLLSNLVNGLLMFNWRGDVVWVTTVPLDPALDWVSGGLFVLGVVWLLYSLIRHREPVALYLLVALLVLMLPSVSAISFPQENPSVTRAAGNTPIVALLVAAPIYLTGRRLAGLWPSTLGKGLMAGMLAVLLVVTMRVNYDRYFVDYAAQYRQSARNSSEVAAVITSFSKSVGSLQNVFIQGYPHWIDIRNVAFNLGSPDWNNVVMTPDDVVRHIPPPGNKLYIINKGDKDAVQRYQQKFPEGQLREQRATVPGQEFLVFFVPGKP